MFLKLMEGGNGGYRIIEVVDCAFHWLPEPHVICEIGTPREQRFAVKAPVYLLNRDGKTIQTFYPDRKTDR